MIKLIILSIIFTLSIVQCHDPFYSISAPDSIRPNGPYNLLVTIHQASSTVKVEAHIKRQNQKNRLVQTKSSINSGNSELLQLNIGNWLSGNYILTVTGKGGITFSHSERLNYNSKTSSLFIQTDKAIYKPRQIVHFRLISIDVTLRPFEVQNASIYIIDSQSNRVKQWTNIALHRGMFENELQLSDQVVQGEWIIRAELKTSKYEKKFTVEEYVLPTFQVEIQTPPFGVFSEPKIPITVDAKYTYGKAVKGNLTLNVKNHCRFTRRFRHRRFCHEDFSVQISIDGKAKTTVDFINDLRTIHHNRNHQTFTIFAKVTEELTGREQTDTKSITFYNTKYKLSFSGGRNFKPGLNYTTILKISLQDGSPPVMEKEEIRVLYYDTANKAPPKVMNYTIPPSGEIEIDVSTPTTSVGNIRFKTEYKGCRAFSYVHKAQSLSQRFLQISLMSKDNKVGKKMKLAIDSTTPIVDNLILLVVGRGRILLSKILDPSMTVHQNIIFQLTPEMAPKVQVIIYYLTISGEIVGDAIDFSVDGVFRTQVEVNANPNDTKPGSEVEVSVTTQPYAYVGLLAIDQSVLLLRSGNDITTNQIIEDLNDYEIGQKSSYSFTDYGYYMRPWRPSYDNTIQLFSNVGLIFLTNGLIPFRSIRPIVYDVYDDELEISEIPEPVRRLRISTKRTNQEKERNHHQGRSFNPEMMEPKKVRRHFPETFLWTNATANENGTVSIETSAPDTITSYFITAFAMDEETGLGLSTTPAKLRIFRPFFVVLNLPYSIVRGEYVALQAIIFNYLKSDVPAEITLENNDNALEFVELKNSVDDKTLHKFQTKTITAKANEGTSVSFLVSAKKIDYVDIKVTARSAVAADAISKTLLVKCEGRPLHFNKPFLINLDNSARFEEKVVVRIPDSAVSDSEKIEVSAIGDIMGTTLNNLDKLLRMPYGCGEQNMLNFVPNIVITEYLTKTKQLSDEIKSKAFNYMESGYQRELTYKRQDGSFSAFGNSDSQGSVWLTAFVVKSFVQAKPYITIDDKVIKQSLKWLSGWQTKNGSFDEVGNVLHKAMQGGSAGKIALTAYVLSAFLESKSFTNGNDVINKAVVMLENELPILNDDYDLAITTYVLHLANSSQKDVAFEKLNQRSIREKDFTYWSDPLAPMSESNHFVRYNQPKPVEVEMTSYALLTYVLRNEISAAIPIMRWMVSKRNENGGFQSTQDTVVGIQALGKFAASMIQPEGSTLNVVASFENSNQKEFTITKDTALILHREELPRTVREVSVSATGKGAAVVQVSWSYNVLSTAQQPAFGIVIDVTSKENELTVEACTDYIYEIDEESNMAVVEVEFPSGYVADLSSIILDPRKKIKRVESKDSDTVTVIYFDSISNEVCVEAKAQRAFTVANAKPALVKVYDYYEPTKNAQQFYDAPTQSICDLCESAECKEKEKCPTDRV